MRRPRRNVSAYPDHRASGYQPGGPAEVFIDRKQRVRLQLAERPPQFLLDPIDSMEEIPAVDAQFARAKLPIGAQQKVIAKKTMLRIVQNATRYQAKIGDIFFVFSSPCAGTVFPQMRLERNAAQVLLLCYAALYAVIAYAKDRPQHAIACYTSSFTSKAQS